MSSVNFVGPEKKIYDGPLTMDNLFPDMGRVSVLYPGTSPERPSLAAYGDGLRLQGRVTPAVHEALSKADGLLNNYRALIYVAGPLTGVSEDLKLRYGQISELLKGYGQDRDGKQLFFGYVPHLHGTDPVKHPQVTGDEVRDIDYLFARVVPSMHINCLHPIAHGNAIEEGWAEQTMIPTIYMNPRGNRLSRLTAGMNNIAGAIEYDDFSQDGLGGLRRQMDKFACFLRTYPDRDPREFYYRDPARLRVPITTAIGLDHKRFNPIFPVGQFRVYIGNPNHPAYGQAGQWLWHDWKDTGDIGVRLASGELVVINDNNPGLDYFLN